MPSLDINFPFKQFIIIPTAEEFKKAFFPSTKYSSQ
jgi:hypothetical protein